MARPRSPRTTEALAPQDDARAPLDRPLFLARATAVVRQLEADLLERAKDPAVRARVAAAHAEEVKAERTGEQLEGWLRAFVTQVAVAWVLSGVFTRVLEDRGLVAQARIAGPGATDAQKAFFEIAPSLSERDYLRLAFRELGQVPATAALFDEAHSPIHVLAPSAEGAKAILRLFREASAEAPAFRFGHEDTRFLGDLYQDLSEAVRERYALLQTPDFIERYILRRTLDRAIERFGLDEVTVIDPTCGSGHFLLGAFARLMDERARREPGSPPAEIARRALDQIAGADLNPYAVAIARFRLTLAYLDAIGVGGEAAVGVGGGAGALAGDEAPPSVREGRRPWRLRDVRPPPLHLTVADSLLFNPQKPQQELGQLPGQSVAVWWHPGATAKNDEETRDVLGRTYAAVVGNPPYITVKDATLRERYRTMYPDSAAGKYSLAAPFLERFFQLARPSGLVGTITANSFMKREFGKKVIEKVLPALDLDGIVNTSGAFIPGHGTPTVILFGANRPPAGTDVLAVLAKRGEPATPADPAKGLVWSSIEQHGEEEGFEDDFVSVSRVTRETLKKHPWSLGGGGAAELKELLEERCERRLGDVAEAIGFDAIMGEDELFVGPPHWVRRLADERHRRAFIEGEVIRDWAAVATQEVLFPYDDELRPDWHHLGLAMQRHLWAYRRALAERRQFGKSTIEAGLEWYEYRSFYKSKRATPLSIAYAEVATHNHFVLDRGGKVFKQTAPIIKLKPGATEEEHLVLLAYLNSSTACFWMKQVCFPKSNASQKHHPDPARTAYAFSGTALSKLPMPDGLEKLVELGRELDGLGPAIAQSRWDAAHAAPEATSRLLGRAVAVQEEIDWVVYSLFGNESPLNVEPGTITALGSRPFELDSGYIDGVSSGAGAASPRKVAAVPTWQRRTAGDFALIEARAFKRQWRATDKNVDQEEYAASLGDDRQHEQQVALLEDSLRDAPAPVAFPRIGSPDASPEPCAVAATEAVPYLAALRYTDTGLEKRAAWERTWDLQRKEDAGTLTDAERPIPVPPKYDPKDFRDPAFFRLRGKLDVPKERFISYPGCESDEDGEPVFGWAGWNHLQQAQALAALYEQRKKHEGWTAGPPAREGDDAAGPPAEHKLTPMLAGLLELLPWLLQWHDEPDEAFGGLRMGQYFDEYLAGELRAWGLTREDLRAWRPVRRRGGKKAAAKAPAAKAPKAPRKAAGKTAKRAGRKAAAPEGEGGG